MNEPFAPHAFSMTLSDSLFAHWPFEPERLRPHVPDPLELDTYDGRAWVSVVPFVLARAGIRFSPAFARLTFPELNVRTYVRFDGTPGLYFFSVDVDHPLVPAVVAGATRLPCFRARMDVRTHGDRVDFWSVRERPSEPPARFDASYRPDGEPFRAEPGTLDHWLAERRRMYDPTGRGVLYADIAHAPWPLQPADATVRADTMLEANGLPSPESEPRFRYVEELPVIGSVPRLIRGLDDDPRVRPRRLTR